MNRTVLHSLRIALLAGLCAVPPAWATLPGEYEVFGVAENDMLKLRAAPGTGNVVIIGLPNGAVVRIVSCQQIGGTNWCKVFLEQAPGLRGYVSHSYLREKP